MQFTHFQESLQLSPLFLVCRFQTFLKETTPCKFFPISAKSNSFQLTFSCWVRPDYVGLAIILPIAMLIIGDILITVLLIKQMFYTGMGNANNLNRKIQSKSAKKRQLQQKLIVIFSMQIILGLPWVSKIFWRLKTCAFYLVFRFYNFSLSAQHSA